MLAQSLKNLKKAIPDITKNDIFTVPVDILEVQEGFNPRGLFSDGNYYEREDVKQHIRNLADSYKEGRYVPPIVVKVIDGKVLIRDGHCRHKAILLAKSEGAEIQRIPVLELKNQNEQDENLLILTSNDGFPLSLLERAAIYGRYKAWGWTLQEISKAVGKTISHIANSLALLELPLDIKKEIDADAISASYALELYREHGTKAIDIIKEVQKNISKAKETEDQTLSLPFKEEIQEEGIQDDGIRREPVRITRRKVEGGPRLSKKIVEKMRSSFESMTQRLDFSKIESEEKEDVFTITITREEAKVLLEIKEKLEKKAK